MSLNLRIYYMSYSFSISIYIYQPYILILSYLRFFYFILD